MKKKLSSSSLKCVDDCIMYIECTEKPKIDGERYRVNNAD